MLVHCHVRQYGLGHPAAYFFISLAQSPLGINNDIYCNGRAANLDDIRIEAHHIADKYRLLEHEGIYRYRYDAASGPADCRQAPGYVYLRHDPASEYVSGIVGVGRHWHQTQYRVRPFRQRYLNFCVSVCHVSRFVGWVEDLSRNPSIIDGLRFASPILPMLRQRSSSFVFDKFADWWRNLSSCSMSRIKPVHYGFITVQYVSSPQFQGGRQHMVLDRPRFRY